ncbi:putative DnaJ domain, Chaperone J-domain superfamily [Helianthus anomalus]
MKTLSRCRNNIEADNVVLIDVDTYDYNNVIILDIPESHTKKQGGSNDKSHKTRPRTYIYIDDDDDDDGDESPCDHNAGADVNGERNFENGASSSRRYGSENPSPVKLSKGKRTYSGRGFKTQSDSDSSDDDGPDCEFMEDFSGKLREEWERASLKRKGVVQNDHASSSMPYADTRTEVGVDKNTQHDQGSNVNGDVDGGKDDLPLGETPETSSEEENEKNDLEIAATVNDEVDVAVENSIIGEREKLKETDEYKRALEEELSARQEALQRQAEEAQQLRRLLKRKKAEGLRLLDMERRQKQRVEEIRESQKKDEENMNLKEQYRTEVIQDLKRLEITCLDMASLLRGLGIQVGNGPVVFPNEVRAAYKRALLSFHPDRASGSDMRQQVEAEEKFKLISRMKEKFSL